MTGTPVKPDADWGWARFSCVMAVFLICPAYLTVELGLVSEVDVPDIYLLMPAIYLASSFCVLRLTNRPSTRRGWMLFFGSHLFTIAALLLLSSHLRRYLLIRAFALMFRFCILAAVLVSVMGVVLFAETCRRGKLRWNRWVPSVLGFCFAVGLVAACTEIASRVLGTESDSVLVLPDLPSAIEGKPILVAAIGGSTMKGFPYAPHYGIAQVAGWRLRQQVAEEFEVINLAMTGCRIQCHQY